MVDLKEVEFQVLTRSLDDKEFVLEFDTFDVKLNNYTMSINFNNKSDYNKVKHTLLYVYYLSKEDEENQLLIYEIKPNYVGFNNTRLLGRSKLYRNLFGYSLDINIKRLILFLSSMDIKTSKRYIGECSDELKSTMTNFFSKMYDLEPEESDQKKMTSTQEQGV